MVPFYGVPPGTATPRDPGVLLTARIKRRKLLTTKIDDLLR